MFFPRRIAVVRSSLVASLTIYMTQTQKEHGVLRTNIMKYRL